MPPDPFTGTASQPSTVFRNSATFWRGSLTWPPDVAPQCRPSSGTLLNSPVRQLSESSPRCPLIQSGEVSQSFDTRPVCLEAEWRALCSEEPTSQEGLDWDNKGSWKDLKGRLCCLSVCCCMRGCLGLTGNHGAWPLAAPRCGGQRGESFHCGVPVSVFGRTVDESAHVGILRGVK